MDQTKQATYKDYLKQQGQEQLDAINKQLAQVVDNNVSSASSLMPQMPTVQDSDPKTILSLVSQLTNHNGQNMPGGYGGDNYSMAGGQGSILSQAGPITENFGQNQPGVEVFSHGFTNGTGIGVPTGTKVALPPGQWGVVDSYANDNRQGHIGDGTNSGYGNSVLVQNMQTGEKLRFSHLSRNGAKPGQVLPGGTVFGETGATGNVTGPHLNLEYYQPGGQLGDVLRSPYANYLGVGGKGKGKGGGNPLLDAMGRLASGVKQTGQDFASGYMSDPQDPSASETSVKGFGNFLANGTPAGEGGALVGHALGVVAPHVGQAAHGLTALPLMAGTIGKLKPNESSDLMQSMKNLAKNGQDINYMMGPGQYEDQALRHYAAKSGLIEPSAAQKLSTEQLQGVLQPHVDAHIEQSVNIPHMDLSQSASGLSNTGRYPEIPGWPSHYDTTNITPIKSNGRIVGGVDATKDRFNPERMNIHYVRIVPEEQGKGLGTEAVNQLFKDNPDISQLAGHHTAESKSFWQKQGAKFYDGNTVFTIDRPRLAQQPISDMSAAMKRVAKK